MVDGNVTEEEEWNAYRGCVDGDTRSCREKRDLVEADQEELVWDVGQEDQTSQVSS